ncbi:MAG TPA: carboxypeptidase-like regulatory domain-containing protein [Thermoanaerobaculia bacterium]|nr:carboxypeptidase-like regulatory domain-containing protein [Thermoanaerobaculia bacterium]
MFATSPNAPLDPRAPGTGAFGRRARARRARGLGRGLGAAALGLATAVLGAAPAAAANGKASIGPAPGSVAPLVREHAAVAGKVLGAAQPLSAARVYVYRLSDLDLERAVTDEAGRFLFESLPAGLYKIIAHKPGFVPSVVRLTRSTAEAYQFVELELSEEARSGTDGEDFWSLRSQVPPDVLREIQVMEIEEAARQAGGLDPAGGLRLLAEMRAMTGIDEGPLAGGAGQVTRGGVGIEGQLGSMRLGLEGDYWQLHSGAEQATAQATGEASELSLELANATDTLVQVVSRSNHLLDARDPDAEPIDFEHYRLSVSHDFGARGRSDFSAQYTSESNFHRHGWVDPLSIPEASRSWRVEGTYTAELSERASLQTGLRYRQRQSAFGYGDGPLPLPLSPEQEQVDLFGRAALQVQPSVLLEYGLYTTLRDGSLSLSPRGGVVVQLSPTWQAAATVTQKVHEEGPTDPALVYRDFAPMLLGPSEGDDCEQGEDSCYQLVLTHQTNEDESLSIGAVHREFDETRRLYFSDELADRFQSLYVVPGDALPELQVAMTRRITPKILARLESSLASGGGGIFYATDTESYENAVRYLVTSLDTRFTGTSTGLFIAFHHLRQDLASIQPGAQPARQLEVERLELMLTQDLNILLGMATDLAVQLNMQLSRGALPGMAADTDDQEISRRLLGGLAFRF